MISVTSDFKTEVKKSAREIKAYIKDQEVSPTELNEIDGLKSLILTQETSLLRTLMRQVDIKHYGTHNFLDQYINIGFGVVLPDTSTEYIDYGSFKIIERKIEKDKDYITLKGYDKMLESLQKWDLDPIYDLVYPATVLELLQAICTRLSWTLKTTTFVHYDSEIPTDVFTGAVNTYRDVLEMIAEVTGTVMYFDVDDELVLREVDHATTLDTLDASEFFTMDIKSKWGEVNSVVLARTPQEDNIVQKDDTSISANGLTEIKIENNLIVDADRESWIGDIYTELHGLEFYPFDVETAGLGYFQVGDRIIVEDLESNQFEVVILGTKLEIVDGGLKERLWADVPDKTSTQYQYAGIIGQAIKNAQIIVDKQKGEIEIITQDISGLASIDITIGELTQTVADLEALTETQQLQITELQQTVDALELSVQGLGGTNLIKNSVGLKGDIGEWQDLDENSEPVDARNSGTIINDTDLKINSESGSGIQLNDQFIKQQFTTILDETYTIYFRYKSNDDATVTVTGHDPVTIPESTDWAIFKHSFLTNSVSTTIQFENITGDTITLTDIVVKLGDVNGWTQAPNELYGTNFRFDREGFSITSLTDTFRSLLDNTKLAVYDTAGDKVVLLVSKDSGIITRLIAQTELTIQRYEDADKSLRFIPVDTGALVVIND